MCDWGEGEGGREEKGKRSQERPGRGEGERKGPGRRGCALRLATMQTPSPGSGPSLDKSEPQSGLLV